MRWRQAPEVSRRRIAGDQRVERTIAPFTPDLQSFPIDRFRSGRTGRRRAQNAACHLYGHAR
ncbi:MAG TPA: hypothetical protein VMB03_28235 [Bryobacteraceae bacterium]|nr:hypothetical protein [Bryobacteraceae bacterium]